MSKKKSVIIAVVITFVLTFTTTSMYDTFVLSRASDVGGTKQKAILGLLKNKFDGNTPDKTKLQDGSIKGLVSSFGDHYTAYYNADEFKSYSEATSGSIVGVGLLVGVKNETKTVLVIEAYSNAPAAKAGIVAGDEIIKIDAQDINGNLELAVEKMKGTKLENPRGKEVVITVRRANKGDFDVKVVRDVVEIPSVISKMMQNSIGYIRISSFTSHTDTEFKAQLDELKKQNMQKLIIDLRDNPGGDFDVVCNIADIFLPKGVITYTKDKNGKRQDRLSDANEYTVPMTVLINKNSASASEVFTGSIKYYKKATVIGEKSYGKGIVQTVYDLKDGTGITVTTERYYYPNDVCIHGTGIEPDISVATDEQYKDLMASQLTYDQDNQLQKAVEVLSK